MNVNSYITNSFKMLITFCFVLKLALMIPNISINSSSVALEKEKMKGFSLIYLSGDFKNKVEIITSMF